jgi:hypothetical protein
MDEEETKLKTYRLSCNWMLAGTVEVEAPTLNDAVADAYKYANLPKGNYVDDSFVIDGVYTGKDDDDWEDLCEARDYSPITID